MWKPVCYQDYYPGNRDRNTRYPCTDRLWLEITESLSNRLKFRPLPRSSLHVTVWGSLLHSDCFYFWKGCFLKDNCRSDVGLNTGTLFLSHWCKRGEDLNENVICWITFTTCQDCSDYKWISLLEWSDYLCIVWLEWGRDYDWIDTPVGSSSHSDRDCHTLSSSFDILPQL